jgi:hypothetical protein
MCNPTARTQLAVMLTNAAAVKRMPTVVDLDFLSDMGRMNGRSRSAGNHGCSRDRSGERNAPPSCTRSSRPQNSTISIRRLGSPTSSPGWPTRHRQNSPSSSRGSGVPNYPAKRPHNRSLRRRLTPTTTPGEQQIGIDAVARGHLRHGRAGREALGDHPPLLIARPEATPTRPFRIRSLTRQTQLHR